MSEFNENEYLSGIDEADALASEQVAGEGVENAAGTKDTEGVGSTGAAGNAEGGSAEGVRVDDSRDSGKTERSVRSPESTQNQDTQSQSGDAQESTSPESEDELTPLGKAKKEAAEYLEALQRERASFVNFRNRSAKEQDRFREHGIVDVLTALLPALDDIDRIRQHGEMDESFSAVSAKIDKTFEKFGVEKFGEKGEDFDPTKHEAILRKSDADATNETVDTVVEYGYRIGDRVIRAARVVVSVPQD